MEAHLCLPTRHFPAMRHHKTVLVHSSVRLPALQVNIGPPPGAARVAVVGAGVVLACTLGAMYWKRARALQLPMHCNNQTGHGGNGDAGIVSIEDLRDLLPKICIRKIGPKPPRLATLIHECLAQKDLTPDLMTSLLGGSLPEQIGNHEYELGIVLILALISEKKYAKAQEICNKLIDTIPSDARPHLLLDVINMLQLHNETSTDDEKLKQVEEAWEKHKGNGNGGIPTAGPPPITN